MILETILILLVFISGIITLVLEDHPGWAFVSLAVGAVLLLILLAQLAGT